MIATGLDDSSNSGDTLRDRLRACHQQGMSGIPVPELLRYVADVAEVVDLRRERHGNVKPDTIRVFEGRARLDGSRAIGLTRGSSPFDKAGTPAYMAPEAWHADSTAKSDQYALACTYVELRVGHPPFTGPGLAELMSSHMGSAPDLGPCTLAEQRVLNQALAKDPDDRFGDCREFSEQLAMAFASGA